MVNKDRKRLDFFLHQGLVDVREKERYTDQLPHPKTGAAMDDR